MVSSAKSGQFGKTTPSLQQMHVHTNLESCRDGLNIPGEYPLNVYVYIYMYT